MDHQIVETKIMAATGAVSELSMAFNVMNRDLDVITLPA